jgi:predicted DNA-binding transcriptional regulator AlpA
MPRKIIRASSGVGCPHNVPRNRARDFPIEGLVNIDQILKVYPVSIATIYGKIKNGSFPKQKKIGRSSFWDAVDVRRFLQEHGAMVRLPNAQSTPKIDRGEA